MDERRIERALRTGPPFATGYQPRTLALEPEVRRAGVPGRSTRSLVAVVAVAAVLLVVAWLGSLAVRNVGTDDLSGPSVPAEASPTATDPTPEPGPVAWSGPVREGGGGTETMVVRRVAVGQPAAPAVWEDEPDDDSAAPWTEIIGVRQEGTDRWIIDLAAFPPPTDTLDPTETVIAYGLVFDTDDDGTADYEVGISNEALRAGDYRVWVTDLATGETDEQVGPPYGYPVEFSHPDEWRRAVPDGRPEMRFLFLQGSAPEGVGRHTRFYAWSSLTEGGEVVAWDYAPDKAWLLVPDP
jgi:hypothetical protein